MAGKRPAHSDKGELSTEETPQPRSRTRGRRMIPRQVPNPEVARQRARIAQRAKQEPGAQDQDPPASDQSS